MQAVLAACASNRPLGFFSVNEGSSDDGIAETFRRPPYSAPAIIKGRLKNRFQTALSSFLRQCVIVRHSRPCLRKDRLRRESVFEI